MLLRDWRLKAAIQKVLSAVPGGSSLNYRLQRHITRSLPISDGELFGKVTEAQRNLLAVERLRTKPIEQLALFEFGVGWDLLMPIAYYAMGVERQTVIDLQPLARPDLMMDAARRLAKHADRLGLHRSPELSSYSRDVVDLAAMWGITYQAPMDARHTEIAEASVDLITSTDVMEHVPPNDIIPVLNECARILDRDGLMRIRIDYQDHYSYFDSRLTPYNFLKFGDRDWKRFNPALHYQNRVRHAEFRSLISGSRFRIIEDDHPEVATEELTMLSAVPLATLYGEMAPTDVAIRYATFTLGPMTGVDKQ